MIRFSKGAEESYARMIAKNEDALREEALKKLSFGTLEGLKLNLMLDPGYYHYIELYNLCK